MSIKQSIKNTRGAHPKTDNRLLYFFSALLLVLVVFYFAAKPLRTSLSVKYLKSGDEHLTKLEYIEARVEYKKSEWLHSTSKNKERLELSDSLQKDILSGETFFREENNITMLDAFNKARAIPSSESEGLLTTKKLLESNQPQLAEIVTQTLIEMDGNSARAWEYLGIARLQSVRLVQMTEANRKEKLSAAKEAFDKAIKLDTGNELAKKYLEELSKLM